MSDLDKQVNELRNRAEAKRREAKDTFALGRDLEREARELEAEAAELIAPFKVGDVVEFTTMIGWPRSRQTTVRLRVERMTLEGHGIDVTGPITGSSGNTSSRHRWGRLYLDGDRTKFIKVLRTATENKHERE